jgi:hypothetical protein
MQLAAQVRLVREIAYRDRRASIIEEYINEVESILTDPSVAELIWNEILPEEQARYSHDTPSDPVASAFHCCNGARVAFHLMACRFPVNRRPVVPGRSVISAIRLLSNGIYIMELRADNQHNQFIIYLNHGRVTVYSTWYGIKRFYIVKMVADEWLSRFVDAFKIEYPTTLPSDPTQPLSRDRALIYQTLWGIDADIVQANRTAAFIAEPTLQTHLMD